MSAPHDTADQTIPLLLSRNATDYAHHPALTDYRDDQYTLTWEQTRTEVTRLAAGLADLGLRPGQTMLIMASNRAEHWLVDLAAVHLGAVPGTVYATSSPEQVHYLAQHSRARVAVLEGGEQLQRWRTALADLPQLEHVVLLDATAPAEQDSRTLRWEELRSRGRKLLATDPEVVRRHADAVSAHQPVTVLYTSGTTGPPKGVVLSHHNVIHQAEALRLVTGEPEHPDVLCYLPLAHVAERMTGMYNVVHGALHVHFCADPTQVVNRLGSVRPHTFFAVPRVWEKLAAAARAIPVEHRSDPEAQRALRANLGLDRTAWAASGAAPIARELLELFDSIGIRLREVWGLTETAGAATANRPGAERAGSVGQAVPGFEISTAEDGEILVRGPSVCRGYLQPDGAIQPSTDADGWLHTGDVGELSADGFLTITDRKKELIITASGENVAPSAVEGALKAHPLVGQALAYGDRRPYLVALIVLDEDAAAAWARERGIDETRACDLYQHSELLSEVEGLVENANARLARHEQIKRFRVLPDVWTPEDGELTPTLKVKRRVVHDRYAGVLEELYQ